MQKVKNYTYNRIRIHDFLSYKEKTPCKVCVCVCFQEGDGVNRMTETSIFFSLCQSGICNATNRWGDVTVLLCHKVGKLKTLASFAKKQSSPFHCDSYGENRHFVFSDSAPRIFVHLP